MCPVFWQMKHFPSFISRFLSSTLKESMSIALGSFSLQKDRLFEGPAFPCPWFVLVRPIILIILLHWWSSFVAQSYQSSNFFGGDSRVRIRRCKGIDNVSQKRSIMTGDDLSNLDSDTIILNLAICSSIESSFFIHNVFIFSRASPGELYGANASCKSCLNWANVSKFNSVLFACAVAMASSNSCSFQEAASPSLINDKKNLIFLMSSS